MSLMNLILFCSGFLAGGVSFLAAGYIIGAHLLKKEKQRWREGCADSDIADKYGINRN